MYMNVCICSAFYYSDSCMLTSEADAGVGGSVQLIAIAGMFSGLCLMSLHQEGCSSKLLFGGHLVIKVLLVTCSGVLPGDFR